MDTDELKEEDQQEREHDKHDDFFQGMGKIPDDGYEKLFDAAFEKSKEEYFEKHGYYGNKICRFG